MCGGIALLVIVGAAALVVVEATKSAPKVRRQRSGDVRAGVSSVRAPLLIRAMTAVASSFSLCYRAHTSVVLPCVVTLQGGTPKTLPNGMRVMQWQEFETDFLYKEIFGDDSAYTRGGLQFGPGQTIVDCGVWQEGVCTRG